MTHRRALAAFECRRHLGFWPDLGSHCSRIRRNSSIISCNRSVSVKAPSLAEALSASTASSRAVDRSAIGQSPTTSAARSP